MRVLEASRSLSRQIGEVITHPLRYQCLILLTERTASPAELARELGVDVKDLSYHVRVLQKVGAIELVETVPGRSSVQHFYRAVQRGEVDEETFVRMSVEERIAAGRAVAQLSFADIAASMEAKTWGERPDHHVTRFPLSVDEEGWRELCAIYLRAHNEVYEVCERVIARGAGDPAAASIRARVASFVFEMPPREESDGA